VVNVEEARSHGRRARPEGLAVEIAGTFVERVETALATPGRSAKSCEAPTKANEITIKTVLLDEPASIPFGLRTRWTLWALPPSDDDQEKARRQRSRFIVWSRCSRTYRRRRCEIAGDRTAKVEIGLGSDRLSAVTSSMQLSQS
jgi:hypothetical protein